MPSLQGFSNNAFESYQDFRESCLALLRALKPYQSNGGARIVLPLATGTHFDEVAAQLEGYARALWAVGTLLHSDTLTREEREELIEPYIKGLANGTDPDHDEYWGPVVLRDQRMVEMEIISFALLAAPDRMFRSQNIRAQRNITDWLKTINGKDFPTTNWLWFRVMTNLCLTQVCGVPRDDVVDAMKADLDLLEQFYVGKGWAADGLWCEEGRQADYYSGSFAIQFSQLIYSKVAEDLDPERCARFRQRAREFATSFWRYFDTNGSAIPFGRSLTYRFAFAGFWSAVAFAEIDLPPPLDDWGVVKGLLLRHFRWWSFKADLFNVDGTLTIGFAYPNYYMSEDYNSPQSPYWALKSYLALALPENHPFWTSEEKPLPKIAQLSVVPVHPPMHILCTSPNHTFLLSSGQFCPWPLKATEAKYGKFAYSSHFAFSVPTGTLIQQIAPDNTIAISKDDGDTWRVPWKMTNCQYGHAQLRLKGREEETLPTLASVWKPWRDADILVRTTLIAPSTRWPDWHVRVHTITNHSSSNFKIKTVQGGFSILGRGHKLGETLPEQANSEGLAKHGVVEFLEVTLQTVDGALICSSAGASGIRTLSGSQGGSKWTDSGSERGNVLKPDANTNLVWQRTLIPTIESTVQGQETTLVSAVFALSRTSDREARYSSIDVPKLWDDPPIVLLSPSSDDPEVADCILYAL